jgi:hypothetical protein
MEGKDVLKVDDYSAIRTAVDSPLGKLSRLMKYHLQGIFRARTSYRNASAWAGCNLSQLHDWLYQSRDRQML